MYTKLRENESKYNTLYKLSTQRRYVIKEEDLVKGNETARISGTCTCTFCKHNIHIQEKMKKYTILRTLQ